MRTLLAALLAAAALAACAPPSRPPTLEEAVRLYLRDRGEEAGPLHEVAARAAPGDPEPRVWLAEASTRHGSYDDALRLAREVLATHPCHGMAHHVASTALRVSLERPGAADSMWMHARRAVECAPNDGNAWLTYAWAALFRGDEMAEREAYPRLAALGFFPEPVMEMARWTLRHAPPGAMLVGGGEWDYFPMRVAQVAEGRRPDVVLANLMMMDWPGYVRPLAARAGYPVPPEAATLGDYEILRGEEGPKLAATLGALWADSWLEGRATRPLALTFTIVDMRWGVADSVAPRWDGPVLTLHRLPPGQYGRGFEAEPTATAAAFRDLDLARFDGPQAHPTDRSPFRQTSMMHPAERVALLAVFFAADRQHAGDGRTAREALGWAETLVASGRVRPEHAESVVNTRANLGLAPDGGR